MKVLTTITETDNEGLLSLIGKQVTIFCSIYIYTGKLVGVNKDDIKLEGARLVYETGAFSDKKFKDAQAINPNKSWYIRTQSIESYGELNKE